MDYLARVATDVLSTFVHNWPFLLLSIVAAAALTVYVGTDRLAGALSRHVAVSVVAAVALATLTPFCSCGTTAAVLGMMAVSVPWAPVVAFLVASPLTSPSELLLSAGIFGWPFALVFFGGTIVLGLGAGALTHAIERTGWLRGQARMDARPGAEGKGHSSLPLLPAGVGHGPGTPRAAEIAPLTARLKLGAFGREILTVGRRMAIYFTAFTAVGYAMIEAIPTDGLGDVLGEGSALAVPLAALAGVPTYFNTEASLPMLGGLMAGGMAAGAAMAFLVTGAGTSIGAISGLLVIARRRVVGLVIGILFLGALGLGWASMLVL